jgi:hypothetical protein
MNAREVSSIEARKAICKRSNFTAKSNGGNRYEHTNANE